MEDSRVPSDAPPGAGDSRGRILASLSALTTHGGVHREQIHALIRRGGFDAERRKELQQRVDDFADAKTGLVDCQHLVDWLCNPGETTPIEKSSGPGDNQVAWSEARDAPESGIGAGFTPTERLGFDEARLRFVVQHFAERAALEEVEHRLATGEHTLVDSAVSQAEKRLQAEEARVRVARSEAATRQTLQWELLQERLRSFTASECAAAKEAVSLCEQRSEALAQVLAAQTGSAEGHSADLEVALRKDATAACSEHDAEATVRLAEAEADLAGEQRPREPGGFSFRPSPNARLTGQTLRNGRLPPLQEGRLQLDASPELPDEAPSASAKNEVVHDVTVADADHMGAHGVSELMSPCAPASLVNEAMQRAFASAMNSMHLASDDECDEETPLQAGPVAKPNEQVGATSPEQSFAFEAGTKVSTPNLASIDEFAQAEETAQHCGNTDGAVPEPCECKGLTKEAEPEHPFTMQKDEVNSQGPARVPEPEIGSEHPFRLPEELRSERAATMPERGVKSEHPFRLPVDETSSEHPFGVPEKDAGEADIEKARLAAASGGAHSAGVKAVAVAVQTDMELVRTVVCNEEAAPQIGEHARREPNSEELVVCGAPAHDRARGPSPVPLVAQGALQDANAPPLQQAECGVEEKLSARARMADLMRAPLVEDASAMVPAFNEPGGEVLEGHPFSAAPDDDHVQERTALDAASAAEPNVDAELGQALDREAPEAAVSGKRHADDDTDPHVADEVPAALLKSTSKSSALIRTAQELKLFKMLFIASLLAILLLAFICFMMFMDDQIEHT